MKTKRRKRYSKRRLTEMQRQKIVDLRTHGWTLEEIGCHIGCSHSTVHEVLKADAVAWAEESD